MYLKKIIFSLKKTYIFFFITLLFLNFTTSNVKASIFKVDDIEISEPDTHAELNMVRSQYERENVLSNPIRLG